MTPLSLSLGIRVSAQPCDPWVFVPAATLGVAGRGQQRLCERRRGAVLRPGFHGPPSFLFRLERGQPVGARLFWPPGAGLHRSPLGPDGGDSSLRSCDSARTRSWGRCAWKCRPPWQTRSGEERFIPPIVLQAPLLDRFWISYFAGLPFLTAPFSGIFSNSLSWK